MLRGLFQTQSIMDKSQELVQYFVVNQDLGMTEGKIAAQVSHAAVLIALRSVFEHDLRLVDDPQGRKYLHLVASDGSYPAFATWLNDSMKKVVLRGSQQELERLEALGFQAIRDAGHTQVAPNSLTVVGLPPMTRAEAKPIVGHLRVY